MKKTAHALAAALLLSVSAHCLAGKTQDGGYLGDRTPKEKEICERVAEIYATGQTICFLRGRDLVVGDVSVTLELLNRRASGSYKLFDSAYWADQRVKMAFSHVFRDTPDPEPNAPRPAWLRPIRHIDLDSIDAVTTWSPRADMCRQMNKQTFAKVYGSPEERAATEKGKPTDEEAEFSRNYIWTQATPVPCPTLP